jgi:hypothetical protein
MTLVDCGEVEPKSGPPWGVVPTKAETVTGKAVGISGQGFLDLGDELAGESVEALGEIANVLKEIVVGDEGGDGSEKASGSRDKSFGNAGGDGAKTGRARGPEAREGVNDAPDGAEEADERSDAGGGGEPGHAFFDAANFFCGSKLHGDSNRLKRL